jgi:hypothetical protein
MSLAWPGLGCDDCFHPNGNTGKVQSKVVGFTAYCNRRSSPFIANTRVLISSIDNSVASR